MPLDNPVTSAAAATWFLSATCGTATTVTVSATISVEGNAVESNGDSALQDLVDALTAHPHFSDITGVKSYTSNATQNMLPST